MICSSPLASCDLRPSMERFLISCPRCAIEMMPVSSEITMMSASTSCESPIAARCLEPSSEP